MPKMVLEKKFPSDGVSVRLSLFTFIDNNVHVVYSPALDLYGYGNDEHESRHSFETNLSEYIKYTSQKGTLEKDLKRYGWLVDKKKKKLSSPDFSALIQTNEDFRKMVNSKPFKKFDLNIQIPVFS